MRVTIPARYAVAGWLFAIVAPIGAVFVGSALVCWAAFADKSRREILFELVLVLVSGVVVGGALRAVL